MEIKKETLQVREQTLRTGSNVMVEGDIILPDGTPDMQKVLLADAEAFVQSKELRGGKLHIGGVVQFHLLYAPVESGTPLAAYQTALPFTDVLDVLQEEDACSVSVTMEHIGFSEINSRKLSAKCIVSIQVRGNETKTIAPIVSVADSTIPCRSHEHTVFLPLCEPTEDIQISDMLTLSAQYPDIDEILKTTACVTDGECKVMNGKVLVRGTLMLNTLYTAATEDAAPQQVTHEMPFSEILEAEGATENSRASVMFCVKGVTASPRGDLNGDTKIIHMDATVCATVFVSDTARITMVDDCYSTSGVLECDHQNTILHAPVLEKSGSFTELQKAALPKGKKADRVLSVSAKSILRECTVDGNILHMKGALVTFLLFQDSDGTLCSCVTESPFDHTESVSGQHLNCDCRVCTESADAQVAGDGSVEIRVTVWYHGRALDARQVRYITSCTLQDSADNEKDAPAIVMYFVQDGDTLWNVAKKYGTTPERILHANTLEDDTLTCGQKLLIPGRM